MNDDFGRFCGWGMTKPRRVRIRQIVDGAGARPWRRSRWTAMVWAPASRPWSARLFRSSTVSSSSSIEVWCGLLSGRRERGLSPASPSALRRVTSSWTHRLETPNSLATSAFGRPSSTTAVTTSCPNDTAHLPRSRCERCPETGVNYVVKPDTLISTTSVGSAGRRAEDVVVPEVCRAVGQGPGGREHQVAGVDAVLTPAVHGRTGRRVANVVPDAGAVRARGDRVHVVAQELVVEE